MKNPEGGEPPWWFSKGNNNIFQELGLNIDQKIDILLARLYPPDYKRNSKLK